MAHLRQAARDNVITVTGAEFQVLEGLTSPEWFRTVVTVMLSCPLDGTWPLLCLLRLRIIEGDAPENCEPDDLREVVLYVANQFSLLDGCVQELFSVVANRFKLGAGLALEKINIQNLFEWYAAHFANFTLRTQCAMVTAMLNYTTALPECQSFSDTFMDTLLALLPSTSDESCFCRLLGAIANAAEFSPVARERLAAGKELIHRTAALAGTGILPVVSHIIQMLG
jgi:hypothetical protein